MIRVVRVRSREEARAEVLRWERLYYRCWEERDAQGYYYVCVKPLDHELALKVVVLIVSARRRMPEVAA